LKNIYAKTFQKSFYYDSAINIQWEKGEIIMKKSWYVAVLLTALTLGMTPMLGLAQTADPTWVFMAGSIDWYGTNGVVGWCGVFAKIDEWAEARTFWMQFQIQPIPGNYTFYFARLENASLVKLDYQGKDFYILGLWDVLKITFVYERGGGMTKVVEIIVDDAPGELYVTSDFSGVWKDLTINIIGVDLLRGNVIFYRIITTGPIPKGDVRGLNPNLPDGKIDIMDLVHVARAYGETPKPGGRYDFNIDFNFDFTIDIYDLTTVAASLGKEY